MKVNIEFLNTKWKEMEDERDFENGCGELETLIINLLCEKFSCSDEYWDSYTGFDGAIYSVELTIDSDKENLVILIKGCLNENDIDYYSVDIIKEE